MIDLEALEFTHKLGDSYDEFLQVLLENFIIEKKDNGICLQVKFDENTLCIKKPRNRSDLNNVLRKPKRAYKRDKKNTEKYLDYAISDKHILSSRIDCSGFPFRYANGGVLPMLRINSVDYFCLFYRAINPVGWNISNGASNDIGDLLNPCRIIKREFSEEFLIMDHKNRITYLYDCESPLTMNGTQNVALELWEKKIKKEITNYTKAPIPLKWVDGNDELQIVYKREQPSIYKGFFVNITPEDNAIEIDNIAFLNLSDDFHFYDGEVEFLHKNGERHKFLLNRIIGFFPVKEFLNNLDNKEFHPEFLYFNGERRETTEFTAILEEEYFPAHKEFRSKNQDIEYQKATNKFDLCPITRAISLKYIAWEKSEEENIESIIDKQNSLDTSKAAKKKFDVFLSYKSEDEEVADLLYEFLKRKNLNVFFSGKSIKILGNSEYSKAIDQAILDAKYFILIGSDLDSFESGWVDYEWRSFLMLLRSKSKKGELFTFTNNIDPNDLPLGLRLRQNIKFSFQNLEMSFDNLYGYIK
ncbi:MAG: toll/interleukin-1 receptor domain-containing protein [Candidatus Cloacimonetes bacterium]|nr:toll/interleukin-1 receptor domain-containing protein [Candidatus Cloacimonadota bacterium]